MRQEHLGHAAPLLRRPRPPARRGGHKAPPPDAGLWGLASAELAKLVPSVAADAKVAPLLWGARPLLRDPSWRGEGWVELDKVGQGAASMLGLFLLLLSTSAPWILAIDGPDPGLAPDMAGAFTTRVGALTLAGERQLLWITNRAEALDVLHEHLGVRVFRAVRDRLGATVFENITGNTAVVPGPGRI